MNRTLTRFFRTALLAMVVGTCALPSVGSTDADQWKSLVDQSSRLLNQGKRESALEAAHQALDLAETAPSQYWQPVSMSLFLVGSIYQELGQHEKALHYLRRMQQILDKSLGPNHLDTALGLNKLAASHFLLGQYDLALPLQQRELSIRERLQGLEHPEVATSLNHLANTYGQLGQHDKSLPLEQRALAIRERVLGPEHPETAISLGNLALTYSNLARHDEARSLQQRALAISEKVLGPEHSQTARELSHLASIYGALGEYDKALPVQQRALAIREKLLGPEHLDTAFSLNNLADAYSALGQYEKALPVQQRAQFILEKNLGREHPDSATSLNNLARTYNHLGQYSNALTLQQRALEITEKARGKEHLLTAAAMSNLATTLIALGRDDEARALETQALAIREKMLGPEHPDTALSLSNLASTFSHTSQYDQALSLEQRALGIVEKVQGPEHRATAAALSNLANTYSDLAQYDKALPLQQRALAIREKMLGSEHPQIATSLNNLSGSYIHLAQYDKALPLQQRALAIREKVLGPEHLETAISLNNLALLYSELGQYDKELPLLQRALAIREKVLGLDHPETAATLNNIAAIYLEMAQHDKALPLQQRALAIREKELGPEHADTAISLNNLSSIYDNLGQYETALPLQQRALAIRERVLGPAHPDTAVAWSNLAGIFKGLQYPDAAVATYKRAVNIFQLHREQIAGIGKQELTSYTTSVSSTYQALARLLTEQGRLAEAHQVLDMLKEDEQFDFVRRSADADPRRTRMGYTPYEQAWMKRYDEIAGRLAALGAEERALQKAAQLGLSSAQQARQKALAADLVVARQAFMAYLDTMRTAFTAKGPARAEAVAETTLQAARATQGLIRSLGEDVVLLQYFVTDNEVGMLLTTPGTQLARRSAVMARDLNRQIAEFRRLLREPGSNTMPAAQALYQLLLAPVAQDLEQAKARVVMLSLDGALRYVPFAALHDGRQYATQRWLLPMYTNVVRDRLRDATAAQWQAAGLGVTRSVGEFAALPGVRREVGSIVRAKGGGTGGVIPGEVYLDQAFSAERLKDVAHRPFQLLHVASHFRFSPGTEVNSFLLLGDGAHLTLGDIRTQNYRFDHVDLLTLSACDTALGGGRDAQGREIEGFGVIAQQQGAKSVLATLWAVADESTSALMVEMYRRRQDERLSKIEALRQAQLSLLAQGRYAHPFYWAPFILMGNWQ